MFLLSFSVQRLSCASVCFLSPCALRRVWKLPLVRKLPSWGYGQLNANSPTQFLCMSFVHVRPFLFSVYPNWFSCVFCLYLSLEHLQNKLHTGVMNLNANGGHLKFNTSKGRVGGKRVSYVNRFLCPPPPFTVYSVRLFFGPLTRPSESST